MRAVICTYDLVRKMVPKSLQVVVDPIAKAFVNPDMDATCNTQTVGSWGSEKNDDEKESGVEDNDDDSNHVWTE